MKRKIIKQGHNTLTVTLPSDWVKRCNLQAGTEIDLVEKNRTLLINCQSVPVTKLVTIDICDFTIPLLWRYTQAAYRQGCDEIRITFDPDKKDYEDPYRFYTTQFDYSKLGDKNQTKPALMMVQSLIDRFIGMSIIETGKGYCVVKEIAQVSPKEFDVSLRRIFLIISQMLERLQEVFISSERRDVALCKEIHSIDINIDKLVDFCCRILSKNIFSFPEQKKVLLHSTLFLIELVGDEGKYIGKHLVISKKSLKEILPLLDKVKAQFDLYYKSYYTFSRENAIACGHDDVEIYKMHFDMKNKLPPEERSVAKHLMLMSKLVLSLSELRTEMEFC